MATEKDKDPEAGERPTGLSEELAARPERSSGPAGPGLLRLLAGAKAGLRRAGRWLRQALTPQPPAESALSGWLFLRLLGLVYLIAFLSLWPQLLGLIGSRGMLPAAPFLKAVAARFGAERFTLLPTLFWLGCSDGALHAVCALGVVASLLILLDRLVWPALLGAFLCYLSLVGVGRDFMSFQWDGLLLETGGLALLMLPLRPLGRPALGWAVPAGRWLLLWLVVRFMFSAGWAKLRSGDTTWRDLTALHFHFETQPLPTWLGYYAHQLPSALKKLSVAMMFLIELGVPLLVLVPRLRRYAFWPLTGLMVVIAATGNYGFFNLLSIALWALLLPDAWIERWLPTGWLRRLDALRQPELPSMSTVWRWLGLVVRTQVVVLLGLASLAQAAVLLRPGVKLGGLRGVSERLQPLHVVNRYGLFAHMTTDRPEIILEGSDDGKTWLPYEFKYKPGELARAPRWNAPHQPRLDWQMWFAAMQAPEDSPWLQGLCIRLLQGSPDVLWLLGRDPFGGRPPRYLRATLYSYRFTSLAERRTSGAYWKRSDPQPYIEPVSLR